MTAVNPSLSEVSRPISSRGERRQRFNRTRNSNRSAQGLSRDTASTPYPGGGYTSVRSERRRDDGMSTVYGGTTVHMRSGSAYSDIGRNRYLGKWYNIKELMYWSVSRGDLDLLKAAIQFFPLKFFDSETESDFEKSLRGSYPGRCLLIGGTGVGAFLIGCVIYTLIFSFKLIPTLTALDAGVVAGCMSVTFIFFLSIALIPWTPCTKNRPEVSSLIYLVAVWTSTGFQNIWITRTIGSGRTVTESAAMKVWVDITVTVTWLWGIIVMDAVFRTRTRLTFIAHGILTVLSSAPIIFQVFLKMPDVVLITPYFRELFMKSLCWLQIGTSAILIQVGLIARVYKEFQERVEFLRMRTSLAKINELLEKKKNARSGGKTVVEDLIILVEKAQHIIRGIGLETGNPNLKAGDEILNECIETLGNTDELFAIRYADDVAGEDNVQAQFYNLYANKRAKVNRPSRRASSGTAATVLSDRSENRLSRNLNKAESQIRLRSIETGGGRGRVEAPLYTPHDPTVDMLRNKIGILPSLNLLKMNESTPSLFVDVGSVLLQNYLPILGGCSNTLIQFLSLAQSQYLPNPYHNACHGAVVAHVSNCFARALGVFQGRYQEGWEPAVLTISSLCHDIGHPGRNNAFFTNGRQQLAIVFNDFAVLENYHSFLTFSLLNRDEANVLAGFNLEELRIVRKRIIELILSTDMAQHFETISRFRLRRKNPDFCYTEEEEDMWMVARMCIKIADLSHGLVDWKQHVQWSCRIAEEFYQQGDEETSLGLTVSPLCARGTHPDFAKSQKGFLEFVVQPLVKELEEIDRTEVISLEWTRALVYNKFRWEELAKDSDPPEIPADIRALKTKTLEPFELLRQAFLNILKLNPTFISPNAPTI